MTSVCFKVQLVQEDEEAHIMLIVETLLTRTGIRPFQRTIEVEISINGDGRLFGKVRGLGKWVAF